MKKPKAINLYIDSYRRLSKLSDAQTGRLIKALLLYAGSEETADLSDDLTLDVLFDSMAAQVDRDFEKYQEMCEKRSRAGKAGARALHGKSRQAQANADTCCQEEKEDKNEYKEENKNEYEDEDENKYKAHSADSDNLIPLEYISDVHAVIDYFNQRAGTNVRVTNFGNGMLITKWLRKGYTVEDCKRVIDSECDRLMERGYRNDLLSMFLFGTKFEKYAAKSA